MATSWSSWYWHLAGASLSAIAGAIAFSADCVKAQITPDDTLGAESSVVTPLNPQVDQIEGGAIRGANLFHSFLEFNVEEGQGAYFTNPAGIENILTRVTGGNPSNILGTLGVSGNANLFLINPNRIIFGPNASLDVSGSFMATTANAIRLGETGLFSASEPVTSNLLTVNPSALFFNSVAAQAIVNQSQAQSLIGQPSSIGGPVGLQVGAGQTLALVGGDVVLEGGNLTAAGGRIELGSVAGVGEVSLSQSGNSWVLGYNSIDAFGNIRLEDGAFADVSGEGGGSLQIQGAQLEMKQRARIYADTLGTGAGGEVLLHTTEAIALSDGSRIAADVAATGTGGDVTIETGQLSVQDGSLIRAGTFGKGQGGTLAVTAEDSVELIGIGTDPQGLLAFSGLFTESQGAGDAGDLTITTRRLSVGDGAVVSTIASAEGGGGNLTVTASDSVKLFGRSGLLTQTEGAGAAGDLTIATQQLSVENGAVVSAVSFGQGNSGDIKVNASNSVNLFGVSPNGSSSGLFTRTDRGGLGGNITVNTNAFRIADGAVVDARTLAARNGGNITVNANTFEAVNGGQVLTTTRSSGRAGNISLNILNSVTLSGSDPTYADRLAQFGRNEVDNEGAASGLFANTAQGAAGNGGSISIDPIKLNITDGAGVGVDSQGQGNAGNLRVQAGSVTLDNGAFLSAETASGEGGNITLQAENLLLMRHNSNISAEARGTGNGGNINIDTDFIVAVPSENSDIIANAFEGNGGNIDIKTQGIFGTQFREDETPLLSDITASSEFGVNGVVEINTPDVDPSQGLVTLPAEPVDASGLIAQACPSGGGQVASEFIVTGRGGLPENPSSTLSSDAVQVDLVTLNPKVENRSSPRQSHASSLNGGNPPTGKQSPTAGNPPSGLSHRTRLAPQRREPPHGAGSTVSTNSTSPAPTQIVEANGWVIGANGQVVLIATAPSVTPYSSGLTPSECGARKSSPEH